MIPLVTCACGGASSPGSNSKIKQNVYKSCTTRTKWTVYRYIYRTSVTFPFAEKYC